METKPKAVLLFSGGYDSIVLLHDLIDRGYDVHCLYFDYGQAVAQHEIKYADYWTAKFGITENFTIVTIPAINWSQSVLMGGETSGDEAKDEYVEMRNLIFLSYATSYAEAKGIKELFAGFVGLEHFTDTSPTFTKLFDLLTSITAGIYFEAPYSHLTKMDVGDIAKKLNADFEDIFSNSIACNVLAEMEPCGKCIKCEAIHDLRKEFLN